jgi:hypothetical protein
MSTLVALAEILLSMISAIAVSSEYPRSLRDSISEAARGGSFLCLMEFASSKEFQIAASKSALQNGSTLNRACTARRKASIERQSALLTPFESKIAPPLSAVSRKTSMLPGHSKKHRLLPHPRYARMQE